MGLLAALLGYVRSEPVLTVALVNSAEALAWAATHGGLSEPLVQTFAGTVTAFVLRQQVSPNALPNLDTPTTRKARA